MLEQVISEKGNYRQIVRLEDSGRKKKGTKVSALVSTTLHQVKNGAGNWIKTTKTGRGFRKPL